MLKRLLVLLLFVISVQAYSNTVNSGWGYFQVDFASDCAPEPVTITNFTYPGAFSYVWNFGDGSSLVTGFAPGHTYTYAGVYLIQVNYLNSGGSYIGSDYAYVYMNGDANNIIVYQPTACPGDRAEFEVRMGDNYLPNYTFTWDFGDGVVETGDYQHVSHQYATTGTFNVTCTVNGPCGTTIETGSINIGTGVPFSGGSFQMYPDTVCPGDQVNVYYGGAASVFMYFDDGTYSTDSYYHSFDQPGVYTVQATLYNGCGNSGTFTEVVVVENNRPFSPYDNVYVYNNSPICPGQEVHFSASSQYPEIVWDFGDGTYSYSSYANKIFSGTQNINVSATITNGCGFDTTLITTVQIVSNLPVDDIEISIPPAGCTGSQIPYSAEGMSDPDLTNTYLWDFGDGTTSTSYSGFHTYATDGIYNVSVTVTNGCGVDSTQTSTITTGNNVAPDPNYQFFFVGPEDEACVGDTVIAIVFPYIPGTYLFDYGDGFTSSTIEVIVVNGREYGLNKHAYSVGGNYNPSMTYTNSCGLPMTISTPYRIGTNVAINAEVIFDQHSVLCLGAPVSFNAFGGINFVWDFGDGTGTLVTNTTFTPVYHSYEDAGVYTLNVIATNSCGNFEIITEDVVIPDNMITITTNTVDANCGSADGKAIAVITGGLEPYEINWSSGDTTILVDSLSAGIYVVNVTDKNGCYNFDIATLNDAQAPAIIVNTVVDLTCYGGNDGAIDINVIGSTGPYTYRWSNGETSEDVANLVAGPYEVIVTDANGCVAVASITVSQPDQVQVSFFSEDPTCGSNNGTIQAVAIGDSAPYTYVWNSGQVNNTIYNLSYGIYTVNVIDAIGCVVTEEFALSENNGNGGPAIVVNSIGDLDCNGAGSTVDISVFQTTGTPTFNWSNGASTEDITVTQSGTYSVIVTDGACHGIAIVDVPHTAPDGQNICMVTVDSMYSVNRVVWEKAITTQVEYYNIYRESSQNGLYYLVGTVQYDSLSEFVDYVANPMITAWRYKISAVDFCGVESEVSGEHKTIHLNQNLGLGGAINLIWDHYYGFDYTTYDIIRYTSSLGWQNIGSVSSANTSFTDPTPPADPSLFYVIEVTPTDPCIATRAQNNNSTRSNRTQNPVAPPNSVNEISGAIETIAIYPNPNNGLFTLQADFISEENAVVEIYSMDGKLVKTFNVSRGAGRYTTTIDLGNATPGVYFLRMNSATSSFVRKVIVD